MVVALSACGGHGEEASGGDVDAVVGEFGGKAVEAEADGEFGVLPFELVSGDLGFDEGVVGEVFVEGFDDPVAVAEGVGIGEFDVGIETVVGVAGDVEPVAGPAFAVVWGGEEFVDYFCEGVGSFVFFKGFDLIEGGWEAGEVEIGAADEIVFGGWGVGC